MLDCGACDILLQTGFGARACVFGDSSCLLGFQPGMQRGPNVYQICEEVEESADVRGYEGAKVGNAATAHNTGCTSQSAALSVLDSSLLPISSSGASCTVTAVDAIDSAALASHRRHNQQQCIQSTFRFFILALHPSCASPSCQVHTPRRNARNLCRLELCRGNIV